MIPVASVVTITRDGGSVIVGFAESEDPDAGHLLLMRGPATEADGRTGTDSHCVVVGPATHHGGIESWTLTGHGEITGQALELTLTTEAASTLSLDRRVRVMLSRPPPPNLDATLRHVIDGAPVETLYRPTGEVELRLVAEADWLAWPPRLPEQPIFYPVTNEEYAVQIARDWNAAADTRVRHGLRRRTRLSGALGPQGGGRLSHPCRVLGSRRRARRLQPPPRRPDPGAPGLPR